MRVKQRVYAGARRLLARAMARPLVVAVAFSAALVAATFVGDRLLAAAVERALVEHVQQTTLDWIRRLETGRGVAPPTLDALPPNVTHLRIWSRDGILVRDLDRDGGDGGGANDGTAAGVPPRGVRPSAGFDLTKFSVSGPPDPQIWAALEAGSIALAHDQVGARILAIARLPDRLAPPSDPLAAVLTVDLTTPRTTLTTAAREAARVVGGLAALATGIGALLWLALVRRLRAAESELRDRSRLDALTGLANRAGFVAAAAVMTDASGRGGGRTAVICLDVDGFRMVNEVQGHASGDVLLRRVAAALRADLRREDVIARLGADEFAVAARVRGAADLEALLARLPRRIAALSVAPGQTSASFGAALLAPDENDIESALARADLALAEARAEGGGATRVFAPEMEVRVRRRRRIERLIRSGMAEGRFALAYQPMVGRRDLRTCGAEALMRLTDADGAQIPPSDFIPVAEETGAIVQLGAWAIRTATLEAARWPAPLRISVNLSARQFLDGRLPDTVRRALHDSGLPAARLELEITESLLISDQEAVSRQLADLRAMGVSVAMDDFGAGYSSLAYLWRFGFDRLKLDRSFVLALADDQARARDVIAAIVALGHRLGMTVTAEGIETAAEARILAALGCDEMQGFHFGRPMPAEDLREVLRWTELPAASGPESCDIWGADWIDGITPEPERPALRNRG